ncbi:hypothetical protein [Mesorhizobium sp. A623]
MSDDRVQYIVARQEETRATGSIASSYIPTFGAATTAVDQYRIVGLHTSNLAEIGTAFTDITEVSALSRIAEGRINSYTDIVTSDTALQALLLHDIVHVLTPAPKVDFGTGFISYVRQDRDRRTQFGFDLFASAQSRDWIIAPEFARIQDDRVVEATFRNSSLVGRTLNEIRSVGYWSSDVAEAMNVAIEMYGVPAYLTDPELIVRRAGDGFPKKFYHHLKTSWNKSVGGLPPVVCTFTLPPLLAIVLNRMNNRQDLRQAVMSLRDELVPVRQDLLEFNDIVTQSTSNTEIEARVAHISASFDAILPESRLTHAQKFQRNILSIQRLARPVVRFAAGFFTQTGGTWSDAVAATGGMEQLLMESNAIVQRTVTARTFAGLVKTEAIQSLVNIHLTPSEIAAIERSIRLSDRRATVARSPATEPLQSRL